MQMVFVQLFSENHHDTLHLSKAAFSERNYDFDCIDLEGITSTARIMSRIERCLGDF